MTIGEKIKELRIKKDMTQEKLADYLSVTYQAVSKWECGLSNPDLGLIGPLTRLFNVSADELLCIVPTEMGDLRYENLKALYNETYQTGDLHKRYEICKNAVSEYPGDMYFLSKLAWAEAMLSFEYEDDTLYIETQEKAIRIFSRVIDDCHVYEIRNDAIFGIVQYLSFRGRYDEAKKYLELYPDEDFLGKNELMSYCLVGEEKIAHNQSMLDDLLLKMINKIGTSTILELETKERIIDSVISDKNYFYYHCILSDINLIKARIYAYNKEYNKSLDMLEKGRLHAEKYDQLMKQKSFKYTTPLLNRLEVKVEDICKSEQDSWLEGFIKSASDNCFNCLKDIPKYKKLITK